MRTLGSIVAGMALLCGGWAQARPIEWLWRAVRAEQTLVVSGERATEIRLRTHTERIVERFWRQGGRAVRIEVIAPPMRRGEVLLLKGDQWLLYRPGVKEAIILPAPLHQHEMVLKRLLNAVQSQAMTIEFRSGESVLNRPCVVLMLEKVDGREFPPRHPNPPPPFERGMRRMEPIQSITLWIDRATGLVLRREVRFRGGDSWVRMELTRVEFPEKLAPELFRLPEGITVRPPKEGRFASLEEAQKAAGFTIRLPDYLPEGTQREGIIVRRMRGRTLVAIRYRCPQGDFTLFQTVAPKADFQLPKPPQNRPLNAHFWQAGDYWFGLVGTLPKEEMERIARSIPR